MLSRLMPAAAAAAVDNTDGNDDGCWTNGLLRKLVHTLSTENINLLINFTSETSLSKCYAELTQAPNTIL